MGKSVYQLLCLRLYAKLLPKLPQSRFQKIRPGRDMSCRGNVVASGKRILILTPFLQKHIRRMPVTAIPYQPYVGSPVKIPVPMYQTAFLYLPCKTPILPAQINIFHITLHFSTVSFVLGTLSGPASLRKPYLRSLFQASRRSTMRP